MALIHVRQASGQTLRYPGNEKAPADGSIRGFHFRQLASTLGRKMK
jgi:hypothetical protein